MSWLLSKFYDRAMRKAERKHLAAWRSDALRPVSGHVIEIGAGTGANFPFYGDSVSRLVALEPSDDMRSIAQRKIDRKEIDSPLKVELAKAFGETLPYEDDTFDWAVSTLVLCSVRSPERTLGELARVLKPGGKLAFVEHVLDPHDESLRKKQHRYQPIWGFFTANCHVNRDTQDTIVRSGFSIEEVEHTRMEVGPRIVRPVIRGWATLGD